MAVGAKDLLNLSVLQRRERGAIHCCLYDPQWCCLIIIFWHLFFVSPPRFQTQQKDLKKNKLAGKWNVCMHGCLSRLSLCGPVMDWRPVQGVPSLSPEDCWDRLQPPRDPTDGLSGRKWMDGWLVNVI